MWLETHAVEIQRGALEIHRMTIPAQDPTTDGRHVFGRPGSGDQLVQPGRMYSHIIVQEYHILAIGRPCSLVVCPGKPFVVIVLNQLHARMIVPYE